MSFAIPVKADNPIRSRYWNQVLYLLGMALFADGYPSERKLETCLDVAIELKFVIDPTVKIRRQTLRSWYNLYADELSHLEMLGNDDALKSILEEISLYGHEVDILTSIVQIVIADGDYSETAQSFTKKTVMLWYMPAKHMDDIIYVCADLIKSPASIAAPQTALS